MENSTKLNVKISQSAGPDEKRGIFDYALKVSVLSSVGMPSKIFVFHQSPAGLDGNSISEFSHVASPCEMTYPEDAATSTVPWYRTDNVTVWFRNVEEMETAKQLFIDNILALRNNYEVLSRENDFENQTILEFSETGVRKVALDG